MAHTDKDHKRYVRKHHAAVCDHHLTAGSYSTVACVCDHFDYFWWLSSYDPKWDEDCCRQERSRAAHVMRRARAGHLDWDEVTFDSHRLSVW